MLYLDQIMNDHPQITIAYNRAHLHKKWTCFSSNQAGLQKCENIHAKMLRYFVSKKKKKKKVLALGKQETSQENCVYPMESHFHFITNGMWKNK